MGLLNLLKASWTGKVGQTVGAKWKNKSTLRTFTKPAYTNTPAQQVIREGFAEITSYVALFADQIKSVSALDTKGMSVRNAIIKLNKEQVSAGALDPTTLKVSRGGLPSVNGFQPTAPTGLASINATWTPAAGATISNKAKVVVIAVNHSANFVAVGVALNSAGTINIPANVPPSTEINIHYYVLDYRGSSRVGSPSGYATVTSGVSRSANSSDSK
jgi:hypothetical protein